jgi:hypothetical protein
MTGNELLRWLEELMANYSPGRESGEALRRFVIRECQDIVRDHREAFIEALGQWLSRRQEFMPHYARSLRDTLSQLPLAE